MRKIKIPALVVVVAVGVFVFAAGYNPGTDDRCPETGCVVPHQAADDGSFRVFDCDDTGKKGPCVSWWPDEQGVCTWWYVPIGEVFADGAQPLAESGADGAECDTVVPTGN